MFNHLRLMRVVPKLLGVLCGGFICLSSCNRMATPPAAQLLQDAETRLREGDFLEAINLYERALDGSSKSAEIHYRLALLYDDRMHDPLNALHHFKRYLMITPAGPRAEEVKNFMKRDELALVTEMSGDSVVSRSEAARLRNENLNLRKELEESRAQSKSGAEKGPARTAGKAKTPVPRKRHSRRE